MLSSFISIHYCYDYLVQQISLGLLIYAHIPTAIISLIFGFFIVFRKKGIPNRTLFLVCAFFAIWCFLDLSTWFAFLGASTTMFTWSLVDFIGLLFFFFSYYFLYSFITEKDLPLWQKITGAGIMLPTFLWTFFGSSLRAFDLNSCQAIENPVVTNYLFVAEIIFLLAVVTFSITQYIKAKDRERRQKILLSGAGVSIFLFFFFFSTFLASYLADNKIWQDAYNVEIYGLFGMPLLLFLLGYLAVKQKAFNLKIFTAQALVVVLIVLVGSQFAFLTNVPAYILNGIAVIIVSWVGLNLIRNVKKEIESKEKIEELAKTLQTTNEELASTNIRLKELDQQKSEFVSLASHQLRSPLTAIRGYTSLILEGEFGPIPPLAKEPIEKIYSSVHSLVLMVEDFLNVTRIEQGRMKFDFTDFDLAKLVQDVIYEQKPTFDKAGLGISFSMEEGKKYLVSADLVKIKQVITNFLDNSIKYTPHGSIKVSMKKDNYSKILIAIADTGVGISASTLPKLFNKFTRAVDANKTNVQGTGLGLYVAKQMVEAHKGRVWVESPGEGKGSTFFIELQGK